MRGSQPLALVPQGSLWTGGKPQGGNRTRFRRMIPRVAVHEFTRRTQPVSEPTGEGLVLREGWAQDSALSGVDNYAGAGSALFSHELAHFPLKDEVHLLEFGHVFGKDSHA